MCTSLLYIYKKTNNQIQLINQQNKWMNRPLKSVRTAEIEFVVATSWVFDFWSVQACAIFTSDTYSWIICTAYVFIRVFGIANRELLAWLFVFIVWRGWNTRTIFNHVGSIAVLINERYCKGNSIMSVDLMVMAEIRMDDSTQISYSLTDAIWTRKMRSA